MAVVDATSRRPAVLPVLFDGIPDELKQQKRWVLWRQVWDENRKVWAKRPLQRNGYGASSTNDATWCTFNIAKAAYEGGDFDGVGFVLGEVKGIDLDDCIDPISGEMNALALDALAMVDGYAEVSPSGTGLKIFTRGHLDRARKDDSRGIEVYPNGRYFTVTGHQVNGHEALPSADQPISLFVEKYFGEKVAPASAGSEDDGSALAFLKTPLQGWDADRVEQELLALLDPDCGYDQWTQIGMALHHQGEGDPAWLDLWDTWSAQGDKYSEGYCAEKWASFSEQRFSGAGAVTLASVIKLAGEARREQTLGTREQLAEKLRAATDEATLRDKVLAEVRECKALEAVDREMLAQVLQKQWQALTGMKLPLQDARKLVAPERKVRNGDSDQPAWMRPWVFTTDKDRFYNMITGESVSITGFNMLHDRHMVPFMDQNGVVPAASTYCKNVWNIDAVAGVGYLPWGAPIFEMLGVKWANSYSDREIPVVPPVLLDDEVKAIEVVMAHLVRLFPVQRDRELFLSWLAHNVQHPGKKIHWAPFIYGAPGVGKSFFLTLLGVCMGGDNVAPLDATTVCSSDFTGWATGVAVRCIEEVKLHGHNAHDVMNKLKQFITNLVIDVHAKGRDSFKALNVTNYMALSNYIDGLALEKDDRRYMVLHSAIHSEEAKALSDAGYFDTLFGAVEQHAGAMRKWLLEYPLHPEFKAEGQAPMTAAKAVTIELGKSDINLAAEELLERGAEGVTRHVISSSCFTAELHAMTGKDVYTSTVHRVLQSMGFTYYGQVKWRKKNHRLWVTSERSQAENSELRHLLDSSGFDEEFLK